MGGETQGFEISQQTSGHPVRDPKTGGNVRHRCGVTFQQDSISAFLDHAYPEKFKWPRSSVTANRGIHGLPPLRFVYLVF
jgi:hypothetical protein